MKNNISINCRQGRSIFASQLEWLHNSLEFSADDQKLQKKSAFYSANDDDHATDNEPLLSGKLQEKWNALLIMNVFLLQSRNNYFMSPFLYRDKYQPRPTFIISVILK